MFARVATIQSKMEKIDDSVRYFKENVISTAKKYHGFRNAYLMVDRKTGKTVSVVIWETEQDLQASASKADEILTDRMQIAGAVERPKFEIYEVAVAEVPSTVGMK